MLNAVFSMKVFLFLLAGLAHTSGLLAQTGAAPPMAYTRTTTILEAMIAAGPVMIPLFLLSIFSVMLVIVYFFTVRRGAIVSSGYMATADALLRKRDYLGLLAVSNRHGEAIARIVQKMLDFSTKNPGADFEQVREIAETEGTRVAAHLNNRVIYLAAVARFARHCHWHQSVIRRARSRSRDSALHVAFEGNQRRPHQHGNRVSHRYSGDDFLRILSRPRAAFNLGIGISRHARARITFAPLQQAI